MTVDPLGLGLVAVPAWFGHSGSNAGYKCQFWAARNGGHGAAVMTNSDNGMKLIKPIFDAIAAESAWPPGLPS